MGRIQRCFRRTYIYGESFCTRARCSTLGTWGTMVLGHFLIEGHGIENCPIDKLTELTRDENLERQVPPGPRQLEAMVAKTHPFSSSVESRVGPLIQANGRFCTAGRSGRAEAIMSSLGITKWFKEKPRATDDDLVLRMYPLYFLQEAASVIGPDFYTTSIDSPSLWPVFNSFTTRTGSWEPFGHAKEPRYRIVLILEEEHYNTLDQRRCIPLLRHRGYWRTGV